MKTKCQRGQRTLLFCDTFFMSLLISYSCTKSNSPVLSPSKITDSLCSYNRESAVYKQILNIEIKVLFILLELTWKILWRSNHLTLLKFGLHWFLRILPFFVLMESPILTIYEQGIREWL